MLPQFEKREEIELMCSFAVTEDKNLTHVILCSFYDFTFFSPTFLLNLQWCEKEDPTALSYFENILS